MDEFTKSLSSPSWWVSVVVVGLLLNIFSSYIRDIIDKVFSRVSTAWATRTQAKAEWRASVVQAIVGYPERQQDYLQREFRTRLQAIYGMVGAVAVGLWITYVRFDALHSGREVAGWEENIMFYVRFVPLLMFFASTSKLRRATEWMTYVLDARLIEAELLEERRKEDESRKKLKRS